MRLPLAKKETLLGTVNEIVRLVIIPFAGAFENVKLLSRAINPGTTETACEGVPAPSALIARSLMA
jgi:hypothetical protein